jgi:lysophospholipase L1-like esterase
MDNMPEETNEPCQFRERISDVLQLIAEAEVQVEYQRQAPHVDVASELFNQWDDAYHPTYDEFRRQFETEELLALEAFAELIDVVAAETPQRLPALTEFIKTAAWRRLSAGARLARRALRGFSARCD